MKTKRPNQTAGKRITAWLGLGATVLAGSLLTSCNSMTGSSGFGYGPGDYRGPGAGSDFPASDRLVTEDRITEREDRIRELLDRGDGSSRTVLLDGRDELRSPDDSDGRAEEAPGSGRSGSRVRAVQVEPTRPATRATVRPRTTPRVSVTPTPTRPVLVRPSGPRPAGARVRVEARRGDRSSSATGGSVTGGSVTGGSVTVRRAGSRQRASAAGGNVTVRPRL